MTHLIAPILELLGIDHKQQFVWGLIMCLAIFIVYAIRYRREHGIVFGVLFALLGVSLLVFLFAESHAAQGWAAAVFGLDVIAIFAWHFVRNARAGAERA